MVSRVRAIAMMRTLPTGRTCPLLMRCQREDETEIDVVVKLIAGAHSSPTGLTCELIANLFARDLDLRVPTPFLVEIDPGFHAAVGDPALARRLRDSQGMNFGTEYITGGYTTWPPGRGIPQFLSHAAQEVYAFDAIVQNPDRRKDKPNLLVKGADVVLIDHEMAFSFLYSLAPMAPVWTGAMPPFVTEHIFHNELRGQATSFDRLRGALEAVDTRRLAMYREAVPREWRHGTVRAVEQIIEYLDEQRMNSGALFGAIVRSLT